MTRRKTGIRIIATILMALIISMSVSAADVPDPFDRNKECTIKVETDAELTPGEELLIYKVGDVDTQDHALVFKLTDDFADTKVDLYAASNAERSKNIEKLQKKAEDLKPTAKASIGEDGTAEIKVLPGVYLIIQGTEKRAIIQASMVSVPIVNENRDNWEYTATAQLKATPKEGRVVPNIPDDNVKTGDDTNLWPYIGVIAASAGLLILAITMKKKERKGADEQ